MKKNSIYFAAICSALGLTLSFAVLAKTAPVQTNDDWLNQQIEAIKTEASNIDANVLKLSLIAYSKVRAQGMDDKQLLTVIDFSQPSTEKRLWVLDLKNDKVLYNTWVSHGKNSGNLNATSFSNKVGSLKSSIGVFVTDNNTYMGKRGIAVRLKGLEHGFNDNAYRRAIVVHGAPYVGEKTIESAGRLGRSWGCPAIPATLAKPLINTIKDNTVLVAYYPDSKWLKNSQYLA